MNGTIPDDVWEYKNVEYWNGRFVEEDKYEWLKKFEDLKELLAAHIKPEDVVLHVGCGNSGLGYDMYVAKLQKTIINLDFSSVGIDKMRQKYGENDGLKWIVSDFTDMKCIPEGSVDIVLDKAAMDALVPREIYGEPPEPRVEMMVKEIRRVLKPNGKYLQLSFGQPHMRKRYFAPLRFGSQNPDDAKWSLNLQTVGDGGFLQYYFYIWTKL